MHRKMGRRRLRLCDPPEIPAVSRLEKDEEKLREFYQHGYDQMKANFEALQEFLKEE